MDDVRVGRILRALRIRRGLTQRELGARVRLSQAAISLIERGHSSHLSGVTMRRAFAALDARWEPIVSWRGGELDRLIDEQHARIVADVVRRLRALGWEVAIEATYCVYCERGSIDIIGAGRPERALLIVEVKSDLIGIESTVRKLNAEKRGVPNRAVATYWSSFASTASIAAATSAAPTTPRGSFPFGQ